MSLMKKIETRLLYVDSLLKLSEDKIAIVSKFSKFDNAGNRSLDLTKLRLRHESLIIRRNRMIDLHIYETDNMEKGGINE